MAIEIGKLRNVGVVGHGGVGKTSLVESLLFTAGGLTRLGKIDDGTTTTDFDPDEIKRKISLNTATAFCDYKGHRINLIDTPGYGDFVADARAGLRVAGAALVVVDAVAGVQVQTEKVWKFANEYNLPRAIVINRLDRERADLDQPRRPQMPKHAVEEDAVRIGIGRVVEPVAQSRPPLGPERQVAIVRLELREERELARLVEVDAGDRARRRPEQPRRLRTHFVERRHR